MEQVRAIQELIDEHKEEMPTGVVTSIMGACQQAYCESSERPKLYRIKWTTVEAHANAVRACTHDDDDDEDDPICSQFLMHSTQTSIVEAVACGPRTPHRAHELLAMGKIWTGHVGRDTPWVLRPHDTRLVILHSVEPYHADKRRRE